MRESHARIAAALVALGFAACSGESTSTSDVATTTAGHWRQAHVTVQYTPAHVVRRLHSAREIHVPNELRHTLRLMPEGTINYNDVGLLWLRETRANRARLEALRETHYSLRFSPDGTALALSTDERSWTLFELAWVNGPLEAPFWCTHRTVASLDPWPSSRATVLEVLAEASASFAGTRVHTTAQRRPVVTALPGAVPGDPDHDELRGAMLYACAHLDDTALRAALLDAYVQPGIRDLSRPGDDSILWRCVSDLARTDAAARETLLAGLRILQARPPERDRSDVMRVEWALTPP